MTYLKKFLMMVKASLKFKSNRPKGPPTRSWGPTGPQTSDWLYSHYYSFRFTYSTFLPTSASAGPGGRPQNFAIGRFSHSNSSQQEQQEEECKVEECSLFAPWVEATAVWHLPEAKFYPFLYYPDRVILILQILFLQLLHGFKLFQFVHRFQNAFCFRCRTTHSAVRIVFNGIDRIPIFTDGFCGYLNNLKTMRW